MFDPAVIAWWKSRADDIYKAIPDFGGFVLKADSEGRVGPSAYGRTHADAANVVARATDTEELGRMLRNDFSMMPSVRSTRTTIVLGTLKESARIPIPDETQIAIA